jgi:hypothetical protein
MLHPVVEAPPLERVVHLAGAVAGDDDDRRRIGTHGADLRNRHGELREHFQQERLELVVGAVDLVDEQHTRVGLDRLQQRAGDEEAAAVELVLERVGVALAAGRLGST